MSRTMWTIATVLAVLGCVLFGWILSRLIKAYKGTDENYQPLQLSFRYHASDIPAEPLDGRFSLLMIPMLFYAGLAMAVVAHNAAAHLWVRRGMYALTALGCLLGTVETLLLWARRGRKAAPAAGLGKWICFAVWTAGMFISLFLKGWAL